MIIHLLFACCLYFISISSSGSYLAISWAVRPIPTESSKVLTLISFPNLSTFFSSVLHVCRLTKIVFTSKQGTRADRKDMKQGSVKIYLPC